MEKYGFIYITTNIVNGKRYIGQTSFKRGEKKNARYLGSGKYLHEAIRKYGRENFTREILFVADSLDNLNWAERHFIQEFNAVKSREFYNVSPGGRASLGFTGKKHSETRNMNLSKKFKGHKVSDIAYKAIRENCRPRPGSDNPNAKKVVIYDSDGVIRYECHGNFKSVCLENHLPFNPLKGSYMNSGKPIFTSKSPGKLKDLSLLKFAGWFAKSVDYLPKKWEIISK